MSFSFEGIATLLNWTVEETEQAWQELETGFMTPKIEEFSSDPESEEFIPDSAGFYSRLSADGYLDCTDWSGPFVTINEAAASLLESFGD